VNSRIVIDPLICHGKPVIRGTRVLIANILAELADDKTSDQIIVEYPNITREDLIAALEFSSEMAQFDTFSYHDLAV
jgi:uncharacterized protein (DUF433 family)